MLHLLPQAAFLLLVCLAWAKWVHQCFSAARALNMCRLQVCSLPWALSLCRSHGHFAAPGAGSLALVPYGPQQSPPLGQCLSLLLCVLPALRYFADGRPGVSSQVVSRRQDVSQRQMFNLRWLDSMSDSC